ncbi:hypothetical protein OG948_57515 (plasmid) [Embleya sp. NBC_00888]|uniref:tetratricopeptide repeat protein n=1 Tax=Embleya sp. NBC_00888 TaxID=2975960 RepID=UPI0038685395|nr:hypothetical protein OG948_57515 [Embleya sp. NBC_00888]
MGTDERSAGDDSRGQSHAGESAVECFARCLRELHQAAGSPAHAELIRRGLAHKPPIRLKAASLSDWFTGRSTPTARSTQLAFLLGYLEKIADNHTPGRQPTPPEQWRQRRRLAENERRARRPSPSTPGTRPDHTAPGHTAPGHVDEPDPGAHADGRAATVVYQGDPIDSGHGTLTGPGLHRTIGAPETAGRPVREFTDPFALEVHQAIDAPEHTGKALPVPPVYVPRAHDRLLRAAVERAAGGESTMVTLVAGSSTGKTRACWEALQHVPNGWRLWHPIAPGRPEATLAELSAVRPRTVLWLNEAQFYLEPDEVGERVAAEVRELLRDPALAPIFVLATLSPDPYWDALTASPSAGAPDPHAQARALLTRTDLRVPDAFTGTDLDEVRARAGEDPRPADALASGDGGRVTQFLAGALALLKRYDLAPVGAREVIEAAMDARRLGHGPALRQAFLEDAADAYLTDHESDTLTDDWFEQALAYATTRVHGASAPLTRIRPRRRTRDTTRDSGDQPTYRLADYLEQHAHHARRRFCPRASFWDAAHEHAHTTEDLLNLADAARARLRLRHAQHLYNKAANTCDPRALMSLAELRDEAGDHEGAEHWYREAADAGHTGALQALGNLWERVGNHTAAERLYRKAARTGDISALHCLVMLRVGMGDLNGAERLANEASDAGDSDALSALAQMRYEAGDHDGAERLYRQAADAGNTYALTTLAQIREEAGDHDGAERLYRQAADAGNTYALGTLGRIREAAGDLDAAERLYQQVVNAQLERFLRSSNRRAGDPRLPDRAYHPSLGYGGALGLLSLVQARERMGDRNGAERLAREVADTGDTHALTALAQFREEANDHDGAERVWGWLRSGLDADDAPSVDG